MLDAIEPTEPPPPYHAMSITSPLTPRGSLIQLMRPPGLTRERLTSMLRIFFYGLLYRSI
ncbi:hypothetical protein BDW02DRAFT_571543 [Decorospora gaudefroyi]|uniref:Uncharacterized protein n=1 Tax=Decorospora gaudefroyi TaxID=184978 RepID=A0A6A5KA63_9PLEO|nr:hypothetical protein BDW02DRAFT_571543 [Decorospora gaudefroyi]